MSESNHTTATLAIQDFVLIRTNRCYVWFGRYGGEDARYLLLTDARRVTPDVVSSMHVSHIAANGIRKTLPPVVPQVRIATTEVAEIITPTKFAIDALTAAAVSNFGGDSELSILNRATDTDVNPYQDTFGT
jgi:hypothetical protein